MVGWHHWLNEHEFKQTPGDGEGWEAWCAAVHGIAKSQPWMGHWITTVVMHENCVRFQKWSETCSVMSNSLWLCGLYSPRNSPGQDTGVDSFSLLQGIFPTQGSDPGLLHWRWILYQLSHKGSPRTLEWVTYPFSRGSSWPRDRTGVSCIAGRFFTNWAIREKYFQIIYPIRSEYPKSIKNSDN